jgi:hypothetical protein
MAQAAAPEPRRSHCDADCDDQSDRDPVAALHPGAVA